MQPLPKFGTQPIIGLNLIRKQCVSSCCRRIEDIEEGSTRWLVLVRHVRMPSDGICPSLEKRHSRVVVRPTMDQVDFRIAIRSATSGMNVQTPKVGAKI